MFNKNDLKFYSSHFRNKEVTDTQRISKLFHNLINSYLPMQFVGPLKVHNPTSGKFTQCVK